MNTLGTFPLLSDLELGPAAGYYLQTASMIFPAATEVPIAPGPRPYKSRKNRPCDFCRARKAACKIEVSAPCTLCESYGRQCTFLNRPQERKRPAQASPDEKGPSARRQRLSSNASKPGPITDQLTSPGSGSSLSSPLSLGGSPPIDPALHLDVITFDQRMGQEQATVSTRDAASASQPQGHGRSLSDAPAEPDSTPFSFATNQTASLWVGDSGEADPYLCRRYRTWVNDECVISKITYRRIPVDTNSQCERPVVFMEHDDSLNDKGEPRLDPAVMDAAREEVMEMIPEEMGVRLLGLFFKFVYPYFPVLSRTQMLSSGDLPAALRQLPLSLLAALYATSLPFLLYDDILATTISHSPPSTSRLYRIVWMAITQEMHTPRLGTLQACLLLLQRAPTNRYVMDTPFRWSLVAWTTSLSNVLGMCKSCVKWTGMAPWERRLRGRLWWATYVMDKWCSLGAGMPSYIREEDYDVSLPTLSTATSDGDVSPSASGDGDDPLGLRGVPPHFYHLVHLTTIVSDIAHSYYSIKGASRTATNLTLSLDLAKPLRTRLRNWKEAFTQSMSAHLPETNGAGSGNKMNISTDSLDGNASLGLAYIVAAMTLYRALLRAIENQSPTCSDVNDAGRAAILAGAKECSKEAVEFVEELTRGDVGVWDAFWHSWSRANFALASSFLMRVLMNVKDMDLSRHNATCDEINELTNLLFRWRRVLRLGSGNAGNGMMGLALLRLEGALLQENMLPANGV